MSASDPLGAESGRRPAWSLFRAELEHAGFRPSKTLGQNFLIDSNAVRSIVQDAELEPGERVLEIGAGCGFLTLHLAGAGADVVAVEIDTRLLEIAVRLLAEQAGVRWLRSDALAGKHALAPALLAELPPSGPWSVVSNLPYSVSAPLLVLLSRVQNPPRRMTVLVQEEVARRVAARPGTPEWGPLTARLGLLYRVRSGRPVGAQLFWPRPRVASRVVHLDHQPLAFLTAADLAEYDSLVEAVFRQRRKQLLPGLAEAVGDRDAAAGLLAEAGLDPRARAETLEPAVLLSVSRSSGWRTRPHA